MSIRGVRGATSVQEDTPEQIVEATTTLLTEIVQQNGIDTQDIASVFFTTTRGLVSEFPAKAARLMGWGDVPLLCGNEMAVEKGLDKCIRVMIHWNTNKTQQDIRHIYQNEAVKLRPDIVNK